MDDAELYKREHLGGAWVTVWRPHGERNWWVSWEPANPDEGHTYTPDDADLPADYPVTEDAKAVWRWAAERSRPQE